ncbi:MULTISPECIES: low molecular weight protein-tyrosine-phosphatase [unclassified Pseudoxanthomonas]|uniref:low molecular weight protein-tyrosine-phosphatase n=1 Tax=unclassified Pseudoxanthomonas TaxID=2645906 RepID=UPI003078255D
MSKRILFVCVGNLCRSPTAEVILRGVLPSDGFSIKSAGLAAVYGNPMDPKAAALLAERGFNGEKHISHRVNRPLVEDADIVLAMEKKHVAALSKLAPGARGKIHLLGKWQGNLEIPDPYGRDLSAYERAYQMIDESIKHWCPRI